jgi:predicted ArsR family transcriptional regulator
LERGQQQPVQMGQPDQKTQKQIILDFLQDGYKTSAEIGEELGTDAIGAKNILKAMWERGEVAKASVYARADQKRATYVLWALTADDFIEVDNV